MNIEEFLNNHVRTGKMYGKYLTPAERITCADGSSLSVQAGEAMYSTPRTNNPEMYEEYEVGFPDDKEYFGPGEDDVYGYVPARIVVGYILKHGGLHEKHK